MGRGLAVVTLVLCTAACSSEPATRDLGANALAAMGGEERVRAIRTLAMTGGTGTRAPRSGPHRQDRRTTGDPGQRHRDGRPRQRARGARV